jgi:hypothetical protein
MLNRPPPYFPQNQLSPPDSKKYLKFKIIVASVAIVLLSLLIGAGIGVYYLIKYLAS